MSDLSVTFDGVMYTRFQGDPEIILADSHAQIKPLTSLIRTNRIKAAIFPPENRQAFNDAAQNVTNSFIEAIPHPTYVQYGSDTLSPGARSRKPDAIDHIHSSSFLLDEIKQTSLPVRLTFPDSLFSLMILSSPPYADRDPLTPFFHRDGGSLLVCHTTLKGGGLEFPTGPLSAHEETVLPVFSSNFSLKYLNSMRGWEGRFHATEPGDMIVFGPRFFHRTTSTFEEKGQLAVLASYNAPSAVMAL